MRVKHPHVELLAALPMIMLICRPCMLILFSITASSPRSLTNLCTWWITLSGSSAEQIAG